MPPKKSTKPESHSTLSTPPPHSLTHSHTHSSSTLLHRYPLTRRFIAFTLFLIVVGVPCPPQFFYSTFIAHSTWLHLFHHTGIFSGAVFMCEQAVGPLYTHDHEYYQKFQSYSNLTDEAMFDYLQQWMCVMPPDNYDEFISDTLQRYAEYVQGSDVYDDLSFRGGLENLDLDTILQQHGGAAGQDYMSERIISSVYQEVESEPLVL